MNRFFRSALFPLFVIVLLVYLASQTLIPHGKSTQKVTYSEFRQDIDAGKISTAEFNPSKRQISGKLTDGKKAGDKIEERTEILGHWSRSLSGHVGMQFVHPHTTAPSARLT